MEKLTIKPWQVMQANENLAKIHDRKHGTLEFVDNDSPAFNWGEYDHRIANLTADGMRLDELVENHYAKDDCNLIDVLKSKECNHLFAAPSNSYGGLLLFLIEHPECIAQVKVKQEKKLRPWTMQEFEKHRDEWFKLKNIDEPVVYKITEYSKSVVTVSNYSVTYAKLSRDYTFTDGSPCGVLE